MVYGSEFFPWSGPSTSPKPSGAYVGQWALESDTGDLYRWAGASWIRVERYVNGKRRISSTPYLYDIAAGFVPGHVSRRAFGRNPAVTTTVQDVTNVPGGSFNFPASALAMSVVSTSANDAEGGTGINRVEVHYLDAGWNEVAETLQLNGLTPVSLAVPAIRANGMHPTLVGSGGVAAGDITVTGGGLEYIRVSAGNVSTGHGAFSVPAGKSAFLVGWSAQAGKGKETEVRLCANFDPFDGIKTDRAYGTLAVMSLLSQSGPSAAFQLPIRGPEKTDIKLTALVTDTGTSSCSGSFELWLE
jgi:hypothetical protein